MTDSTPSTPAPTVTVGTAEPTGAANDVVTPVPPPLVPVASAPVVTLSAAAVPVAPHAVTNVYVTTSPVVPQPLAPLPRKHARVAYALMLPSFIGMCGLQHFYLGKVGQGVLWLFTFGLFGFGTVLDAFTLNSQTKTINARRALGIR
ncbi:TM2 domain-containing protein [Leifsonia poae]|uniref:TM2 domain-containing protein n=1 Tax=Leifsonia poae TaxID=110933 RepID=A0A9W6H8J2_9MICO|nr:TM2 domain-containing protein [Leifsonia poae]GLJ75248.1 hypothetical protein GCM10017584_08220 [Leifsonia poae]